jgi:predicted O-methyltransferase YrrM
MDWKMIAAIAGGVGIVSVGAFYLGRKSARKGSWRSHRSSDPVVKYLNDHNIEDSSLSQLRTISLSHRRGRMTTGVETGKLLAILCRGVNARKALDIGVFTGCSSVAMALALPEDGKVISCDVSDEYTSIGKPYWKQAGVASKIDLRLKPATETLQELIDDGETDTFDIIFIDADKENYVNYFELGIQLLRRGGLIVVDNALWSGAVADISNQSDSTNSIRRMNDVMLKDSRIDFALLPVSDGIGIGQKL